MRETQEKGSEIKGREIKRGRERGEIVRTARQETVRR